MIPSVDGLHCLVEQCKLLSCSDLSNNTSLQQHVISPLLSALLSVPFASALSVFLVCACYMLVNCAYMAALEPGEVEALSDAIALVGHAYKSAPYRDVTKLLALCVLLYCTCPCFLHSISPLLRR